MKITVHTDGSSLYNGKEYCIGGWSAVIRSSAGLKIRYGHLSPPSSNNRGEIQGVLYTLMLFRDKPDWEISIYSDSQYVCNSINEWQHKWRRNNYNKIKNLDLMIPMFNLWNRRKNTKISWIRGHSGDLNNELADQFAGDGMRNIDRSMQSEFTDIKIVNETWFKGA